MRLQEYSKIQFLSQAAKMLYSRRMSDLQAKKSTLLQGWTVLKGSGHVKNYVMLEQDLFNIAGMPIQMPLMPAGPAFL